MRQRLNLTIHPEIRELAERMAAKRRRSISQIFEELVEAEWERRRPEFDSESGTKPAAPKKGRPGR